MSTLGQFIAFVKKTKMVVVCHLELLFSNAVLDHLLTRKHFSYFSLIMFVVFKIFHLRQPAPDI